MLSTAKFRNVTQVYFIYTSPHIIVVKHLKVQIVVSKTVQSVLENIQITHLPTWNYPNYLNFSQIWVLGTSWILVYQGSISMLLSLAGDKIY